MDLPPKAEKCGPFVEMVLDELNCNVEWYDKEEIRDAGDLKKFSGQHGGLYLFYLKPNPESDERYPIYVGATKQSFKDRFTRHAERGIIHQAWSGNLPQGAQEMGIYAYVTHYTGTAAKEIKSILLKTFDFALKTGRNELDVSEIYPAEWTRHNLTFPWDEIKRIADSQESDEKEAEKKESNSEVAGNFIRFLLDELNCNVHIYDKDPIKSIDDVSKYPANYGGLYLLYMKPDPNSDIRYPIYVGNAKKSFRARFERLATCSFGGVLERVWSGEFEGLEVYAICTHHQGAASTEIKRFLLQSFNFPFKRDRRGRMRRELDRSEQLPEEVFKEKLSWREMVERVNNMESA